MDKPKRPHHHLCPTCGKLDPCVCADGWKVAYVGCLPGEHRDQALWPKENA